MVSRLTPCIPPNPLSFHERGKSTGHPLRTSLRSRPLTLCEGEGVGLRLTVKMLRDGDIRN